MLQVEEIIPQDKRLGDDWAQALMGDPSAQSQWDNPDSGNWCWRNDGLWLRSGGSEWYNLVWSHSNSSLMRKLEKFVVAITVQGSGQSAGLSFGHFRDFLADVGSRPKRLQLEVDASAGQWRFRIDGQLTGPAWWNSAITSSNDILDNALILKARWPQELVFQDFTLHVFRKSCRVSIVITCNRFLQRLRVALRNWCHQDVPSGTHEVLVVNPGSPDGTHEYLRSVAQSYPEMRICEVAVAPELASNKGAMINAAIPFCQGAWIWFTDADCVFPTNAVEIAMNYAITRNRRILYGERRYLTSTRTDELLSGRTDGLGSFDVLACDAGPRGADSAPWGYTQIVHRTTFQRLRYPETFDHFAHGDNHFVQMCKSRKVLPERVPGLFCLHLDHPFAWYGNHEFL